MYPFLRNDGERFSLAQPLNPCSNREHVKLYAPVDNTQASYDEYETFVGKFQSVPKGHAILTYGASGCGKSSLVYRCIELVSNSNWTHDGLKFKPYVFDFHDEKLTNQSAKQRAMQINDLIAESLEENAITEELVDKFIKRLDKSKSPIRALKFLQTQLKKKNILPIIYFPSVETTAEMDEYLKLFFRGNWILFLESVNPQVLKQCEIRYAVASSDNPVKVLQVHPLTPHDADPFLSTRLALLDTKRQINFDFTALERWLTKALDRPSGGASLKEIEIICGHVIKAIYDSERNNVSYADICDAVATLYDN